MNKAELQHTLCEIDGVQYELRPMKRGVCGLCAGHGGFGMPGEMCKLLPFCSARMRTDDLSGVWIISGSQWHDPRVIRPDDGQEIIVRLDCSELEVAGAIYDSSQWHWCEEDCIHEIEYPVIGWLTRLEAAAILDGGLHK